MLKCLKTLETGEFLNLPINGRFKNSTVKESFLIKPENCYQLTLTLKNKDLKMMSGWDKSGQLVTVEGHKMQWAFAGCAIGKKIELTAAATDGNDKVVFFKYTANGC